MSANASIAFEFRKKTAFLVTILLFAFGMISAQEPSLQEPSLQEPAIQEPSIQEPSRREPSLQELPGVRERAVVMHIVSRIVEQNQEVVWDSENTRVTLPGRPVGIRLVGSDLIVAVQFTPFLRPNGRLVLVAQGEIWMNVPNEGISYRTTMQTIPLEWRELVYFFPLGSVRAEDEARIEIQLTLEPYGNPAELGEQRAPPALPQSPGRNRGRTASQ